MIGITPAPTLSGSPITEGQDEKHIQDSPATKSEAGGIGSWFGFGGLRSAAGSSRTVSTRGPPPPGTYKLAEVRADYVKVSYESSYLLYCGDARLSCIKQNAAGHFTLLAMIVDVPNSKVSHPYVNTVFWSPEADVEGLLGRRPR